MNSDHGLAKKRSWLNHPPFVTSYFPYTRGKLRNAHVQQVSRGRQRQMWNMYYKNNKLNGFKDRHYILREFEELRIGIEAAEKDQEAREEITNAVENLNINENKFHIFHNSENSDVLWIELGCGVGNTALPVIRAHPCVRLWGFDISHIAVEMFRKAAETEGVADRVKLTTCDLASHNLEEGFLPLGMNGKSSVTFGTLIFVLSALLPEQLGDFAARVQEIIAPGGFLFIRDYHRGDLAQQRFEQAGKHVQESNETFLRHNGTVSQFFSEEQLVALFTSHGFTKIDTKIVERVVENKKENLQMHRKWIQARFKRIS